MQSGHFKRITRGDILRNVGSTFFSRGENYFEQGRVITQEVTQRDDRLIQIDSTVGGSRPYIQEILINRHNGYVAIEGFCSCPVEYNCKHVAAACLQFEANNGKAIQDQNDCLSWIDAFINATQEEDAFIDGGEFIAYLLKPSRTPGTLKVDFRVSRYLKKGGLGKGRNTRLDNITSYYPAAHVRPIDREIGQLLEAGNEFSWQGVQLEGEIGYLALIKMLKTGRCFWHDTTTPALQPGNARPLTVQWQAVEQDSVELALGIDPAAILLLTDPPLYLDPEQGCVGLLDTPYSRTQLQQLLNAPTVPSQLLDQFSRRLAEAVPQSVLPPPKQLEVEEINERPTPCLRLGKRETDTGGHYHVMRIRFGYGEYELPYTDHETESTLSGDDKIVRIQRDLETEHDAVDLIAALGFDGYIDHNGEDLIFLSTGATGPAEGAARWHTFLTETLPQLEQQGWRVEYDSDFSLTFHEAEHWNVDIEEQDNDWFDLRFDIEVNDQRLALLPLVTQVLDSYEPEQLPDTLTLHLGGDQYLNIAAEQLKPIIDTLYELYDSDTLQDDGSLRLSRFDAARLNQLDEQSNDNLHWRGGETLRKLGKQLNDFQGIQAVKPPKGLNATLRCYQQQGLNWLQFLREYGFGGILADDMGLGKTVQTIAHLLLEKEQGRMDKPCLIVAPTSLMHNWRREVEQFAPALKILVLQGPERHQHFDRIAEHDLVLSTYPLLARDEETLLAHHYHSVVLDEAQVVKNPKAKAAQLIRKLNTDHRLCLTGTPMENHLGELWALFDFLMPGFLGNMRQFNTLFRTPIEKHGNAEQRQRLAQRVAPFMLRRTKSEVVKELPQKTEMVRTVSLGKKQAALYESIRVSMEHKVQQAIKNKGLARSHITILDALLKLRQACCDPRLLQLTQARKVDESAKMELLMQLLPELVEEGSRILLFSQFTKMLAHIESELKKRNISYTKLTGKTRKRDEAIEKFKTGQANVFLISLKAGGVGLNLTEADTVIHYDPWWNPAAENQATDRAHRIGQEKPVFVYKLVTENSVEEKIIAMQERKAALAQGVYNKNDSEEEFNLNADDLRELFAPLEQT